MNLHDARFRAANRDIDLIRRFLAEEQYQHFEWETDPDDPRGLRYRYPGSAVWDRLDAWATLTYLNRALAWSGQPQRTSG